MALQSQPEDNLGFHSSCECEWLLRVTALRTERTHHSKRASCGLQSGTRAVERLLNQTSLCLLCSCPSSSAVPHSAALRHWTHAVPVLDEPFLRLFPTCLLILLQSNPSVPWFVIAWQVLWPLKDFKFTHFLILQRTAKFGKYFHFFL